MYVQKLLMKPFIQGPIRMLGSCLRAISLLQLWQYSHLLIIQWWTNSLILFIWERQILVTFRLTFRKNWIQKRMIPSLLRKQLTGIHNETNFVLFMVVCEIFQYSYCKLSTNCMSVLSATAVLVIASTEVDKTGASYYGEQTLHYIATNGESAVVQLRK